MNIFDLLIVQPIFNLLVVIYGLIPGMDFGVALIIFTIIIRLLMWPLVKKQLHQTKMQRAMQPELKRIKKQANGDKTLESQLMLELYREKGINPLSSIGVLFLQIPIFIALYNVVRIITTHHDQVAKFTYDFLEGLGPIHSLIVDPSSFKESLLGVVNLSKASLSGSEIYWPLMILALLAAVLQYYQTKQLSPQPTEHKRLRDVLQAQSEGKEVDPTEASAIMTQRMNRIFPVMTFMVMVYLPGAIALYTVVSSIVAIVQQRRILQTDVEDMELIAKNASKPSPAAERAKKATEGVVVHRYEVASSKPRGQKRSKRKDS